MGGKDRIKLDIRLVTATHKNLADQISKGLFREDLYYRIMGLPIELPPLRERGNDILILAKHFADEFAKENKMVKLSISAEAKNKLGKYNYPGNVRELKAVVDLACVMCNGKEIMAEDITLATIRQDEQFVSVEKTLQEYNQDIIQFYLKKYNNNVVFVAGKLDIGKSTIYKMIKNKEINLN